MSLDDLETYYLRDFDKEQCSIHEVCENIVDEFNHPKNNFKQTLQEMTEAKSYIRNSFFKKRFDAFMEKMIHNYKPKVTS